MGVGDSPEAHEIPDDLLRNDSAAMVFTPDDVRKNSPKSLSLVELRSPRDLAIFRKIYGHAIRIGDNAPGWEITFATEFHMTNDSSLFPPLEKWEAKGYKSDVFGRWIGSGNHMAWPLYEGSMIHQFDFCYQSWLKGHGAGSLWSLVQPQAKTIGPRFLIGEEHTSIEECWPKQKKVCFRSVGRNTLTRTLLSTCLSDFPCGNSLSILRCKNDSSFVVLQLQAFLNSFCSDFVVRTKISGLNLNWFVISDCPIPNASCDHPTCCLIGQASLRLTYIHRGFAPDWLRFKRLIPQLASKEWKHWWAVTEADRLRLRVEIDALCADLYGLDPDDFDWIVRDDPTDPKGFYRVDRQLPFQERLTGLAAAFRALKEGKWSAETAASLTNDEFFDLLGIPELTNSQAAHAKGLPGPLIEKRDGCHVWKLEDFPEDDPRHGWTWDDCWNDAVALLGSEDAVRRYVEEEPKTAEPSHDEQPFRLQAKTPTPSQGKLF